MTKLSGSINQNTVLSGSIGMTGKLSGNMKSSTSGAKTYSELPDKPMIEGVTLEGNKSADDLKLQRPIEIASEHDIDDMFWGID